MVGIAQTIAIDEKIAVSEEDRTEFRYYSDINEFYGSDRVVFHSVYAEPFSKYRFAQPDFDGHRRTDNSGKGLYHHRQYALFEECFGEAGADFEEPEK